MKTIARNNGNVVVEFDYLEFVDVHVAIKLSIRLCRNVLYDLLNNHRNANLDYYKSYWRGTLKNQYKELVSFRELDKRLSSIYPKRKAKGFII